ncbi:MAG: hypothetical protein C4318_01985 [Acidimicrobiia bacterium]
MSSTAESAVNPKALVFLLGTSSSELATRVSEAAASAGVGLRLIETAPHLLRVAQESPPDAVLLDIELGGGLSASETLFALLDDPATSQVPVLLIGKIAEDNLSTLAKAAVAFQGVDVCPNEDKLFLELRIRWLAKTCRCAAEVQSLRAEIQDLVTTDLTTGLYNHPETMRLLRSQCKIADRYGRDLSVIYADVDYLGLINEQHGYEKGDDVLRAFASVAKKTVRAADLIGRLAGGDFLLILPETALEGARTLAERIRSSFESDAALEKSGLKIPVTASLACGQKSRSEDEHSLVARVLRALRNAKATGRNRVTVAAPPTSFQTMAP